MQTKNIVQASANVIRITNLKQGDLYKRFDDSSYSKKFHFGIVRNIYNNGEQTFVEATEYTQSYRNIEADIFVIRGDEDVAIFPATIEDLENEFSETAKKIEKDIEAKKVEIANLEKVLDTTSQLLSGELQSKLQSPSFKEISQQDFNVKKLAIESTLD